MKIAMIGQKGIPTRFGGIERHVEALSVRLGQMGHEVLVYTRPWYAASRKRFSKGVRTVATPTIQTKHLDAIAHTFTSTLHAMRSNVDIIHYHGVGPSLLAWIPRVFAPRIRVVSTFHCIDRKHAKWNILARVALMLGEFAAVIFPHETVVVSKMLEAYCMNRFNRDVRYIPNGISRPGKALTSYLHKNGLVQGEYLIMVARLVPHKGAHYLIEAYDRLHRKGQHGGKRLVIVGGSAFTDAYVAKLQTMAAKNDDIVLTGTKSGRELDALFAGAYAAVHPSESEGLPIAVLEAMSHGKTVISSDIPENMEVTRAYGINFRNKSVDDLVRKLRYALTHPVDMIERGKKARTFVLTHFQWDDVAKHTDQLYKSLVTKPAPRAMKLRTANGKSKA